MSTLRFVHAADLHLDSPFTGLRAIAPDNVTMALRQATFDAYDNIIRLCMAERVDALLIAGDVYDGADRSLRAQLKFAEGLKQLAEAGIRSFICHGNHDPLDGWEAQLDLPPGCIRFEAKVEGVPVFAEEPERAMVYGMSYPRRVMNRNVTPDFRKWPAEGFNIGLLHANVGGNPHHDAYGACSVADLEDSPMHYWALGHIHTREILRAEGPAIVYPGNPQGRHPNELGARGVYLVEVDRAGTPHLEFRAMDVIRWESLALDIAHLESEQELLDAISQMADSILVKADGRSVVLRLVLGGRGKLHRWLRRPETAIDLLEQVNEEYADQDPWLWCERLRVDTASPVDREQVVQREDFVGDLAKIVAEVRTSAQMQLELQEALQELYGARRIRRHLKDQLPDGEELLQILSLAEEECLAALMDDEEEA